MQTFHIFISHISILLFSQYAYYFVYFEIILHYKLLIDDIVFVIRQLDANRFCISNEALDIYIQTISFSQSNKIYGKRILNQFSIRKFGSGADP